MQIAHPFQGLLVQPKPVPVAQAMPEEAMSNTLRARVLQTFIKKQPDSMTVFEAAEALEMSVTRVRQAVQALCVAGLLERDGEKSLNAPQNRGFVQYGLVDRKHPASIGGNAKLIYDFLVKSGSPCTAIAIQKATGIKWNTIYTTLHRYMGTVFIQVGKEDDASALRKYVHATYKPTVKA